MKIRWFRTAAVLLLVILVYFLVYHAVNRRMTAAAAAYFAQPPVWIVDAGHGGEDGGAVSASGIPESSLNLDIALKLEQILRLCGYETVMLRSNDISLHADDCRTITEKKVSDLKNRVKAVNGVPNGILVSIHQNHFTDSRYDGAQVFYAGTSGSKELAQLTQDSLRTALDPGNNRQIKRSQSVYLLEQIHCPGILVECGFLSNPQEDLRLQDHKYQQKIACAIGCALAQYTTEGESPI